MSEDARALLFLLCDNNARSKSVAVAIYDSFDELLDYLRNDLSPKLANKIAVEDVTKIKK